MVPLPASLAHQLRPVDLVSFPRRISCLDVVRDGSLGHLLPRRRSAAISRMARVQRRSLSKVKGIQVRSSRPIQRRMLQCCGECAAPTYPPIDGHSSDPEGAMHTHGWDARQACIWPARVFSALSRLSGHQTLSQILLDSVAASKDAYSLFHVLQPV